VSGLSRLLIAYDVALLLEPATLIGTLFGARMNKVMPFWLTTALMLPILAYIFFKTIRKGLAMRKNETEKMLTVTASSMNSMPYYKLGEADAKSDDLFTVEEGGTITDSKHITDENLLRAKEISQLVDTRQYPADKLGLFVLQWLVVFVCTMLAGDTHRTLSFCVFWRHLLDV